MISYKSSIPEKIWTFWDYGTDKGSYIEGWYQGLSEDGCNTFDSLLKNISKIENPKDWGGLKIFLQGKAKEERIWELAFRADNLQHRVFGVFGETRRHAVFLIGCYHKQTIYTPPNAIETAYKRAKALKEREAILYELKIKIDI